MNRRFPRYPDDADYQTNAPSYYEDLARKQKLMQLLTEKIWDYDDDIKEYFKRWEDNLANINEDVIEMMVQWAEDGTLDHIINDTIFNWKADKTYVDAEIERLDKKDEDIAKQLLEEGIRATTFGAVGDGVTDDYLALQNTINEAAKDSGVVILKAEARFMTSKPLVLPDDKSITFICPTGESIIRASSTMDSVIFKSRNGVTSPRFIGVFIDGNHLADYCINLEASNNAYFNRVQLVRAKIAALVMGYDEATGASSYGASFKNMKITGVYDTESPVFMPDYGILLRKGASDNHFDDLVIRNVSKAGIRDESGGNMYGMIHVHGFPEPYYSPDYAIDLHAGKGFVKGLFSDGVTKAGIRLNRGNSTIIGNFFFWRTDYDWDKTDTSGIQIEDGSYNYTIIGNLTFGKVGTDIKHVGNRSGVVTGNTVVDVLNPSNDYVYGTDMLYGRDLAVGRDLSVTGKISGTDIVSSNIESNNIKIEQEKSGTVFNIPFVGYDENTYLSLSLGTLVNDELSKRWDIQKSSNLENLNFISYDKEGKNGKTRATINRETGKFTVFDEIQLETAGKGIVLRSPDGKTQKTLSLGNDGELKIT